MKVYQVILSNVAEHLVIKEIVQANNKNHALNYILEKHKQKLKNFKIVFVEEIKNVASEKHDHNRYNYEFDSSCILSNHTRDEEDFEYFDIDVDNKKYRFKIDKIEKLIKRVK